MKLHFWLYFREDRYFYLFCASEWTCICKLWASHTKIQITLFIMYLHFLPPKKCTFIWNLYIRKLVFRVGGPKATCGGCMGFGTLSVLIQKLFDRRAWASAPRLLITVKEFPHSKYLLGRRVCSCLLDLSLLLFTQNCNFTSLCFVLGHLICSVMLFLCADLLVLQCWTFGSEKR